MMDKLKVPVNYKDEGVWHFEADLASGNYQLDVTPHLFLYRLRLPNGKELEGTIPTLQSKIENYHQDPELAEWLTNALSWGDRKSNYQQWDKTEKFEVDGRSYSLSCNPRTGDIELFFDARIYVSHRRQIGTAYPEVYGIRQGGLSDLLSAVIADAKKGEEEDPVDYKINLPVSSDVTLYEISGWEVWIAYDPLSELLMLHLSQRTEKTHISTLEQDVMEFSSLHEGRYREEVIGILADNGFMDVEL